jgi:hypothetical protein
VSIISTSFEVYTDLEWIVFSFPDFLVARKVCQTAGFRVQVDGFPVYAAGL